MKDMRLDGPKKGFLVFYFNLGDCQDKVTVLTIAYGGDVFKTSRSTRPV